MVKALALLIALASASFAYGTNTAAAETRSISCQGISRSACDVAKDALSRAPYAGAIRQSDVPMACARVVSYRAVPIVWVAGTKDTYDKGAPVIADTGIVYTETFGLNDRWVVTESCIKRSLLNSVSALTLCTGTTDGDYHWSLTNHELSLMKKTGHFTSYAPFLEVADRESLSVAKVTAYYKARYNR